MCAQLGDEQILVDDGKISSKSRNLPNLLKMDAKLSQLATLAQKDKIAGYLGLLSEILSRANQGSVADDLQVLVDTVVNQETASLAIGRQVLTELVKNLVTGQIVDHDLRKRITQDTLRVLQPRIVSYEEQVCPFLC